MSVRLAVLAFAVIVALERPVVAADEKPGEAEKPAAGPTVSITITDSTANEMLAQAFAATVGVDSKSDEGYQKGYELNGNPAREEYRAGPRSGTLTAFVVGRMTVGVEVEHLPPEEMRKWLDRVDLKKLAALASPGGGKLVEDTKLIPALPDAPVGWIAEKPVSLASEGAGFKISQAKRIYRKKK